MILQFAIRRLDFYNDVIIQQRSETKRRQSKRSLLSGRPKTAGADGCEWQKNESNANIGLYRGDKLSDSNYNRFKCKNMYTIKIPISN